MDEPTEAQARVYSYFVDYMRRHRIPPTVRDVMLGMGFNNPNAVIGHIDALIRKGKLRRIESNRSRSVVPTEQGATCPTCGAAQKHQRKELAQS